MEKLIKKIPMDSFFMEYYFHENKFKNINNYEDYDILYIGGNE